jgi:hypothetical protein
MDTNVVAIAVLTTALAVGEVQTQAVDRTFDAAERNGTAVALALDEARELFACKTRISFMQVHGTQVSYIHPNGEILLWYPGNSVVLPGKWRLETRTVPAQPSKSYANICFSYPTNSYNPATGIVGNQWQCMPAEVLHRLTVDRADGDVFGLRTRTAVPFRLSPERTTIAELKKRFESLGVKLGQSGRSPETGCEKGEVKLDRMRNG